MESEDDHEIKPLKRTRKKCQPNTPQKITKAPTTDPDIEKKLEKLKSSPKKLDIKESRENALFASSNNKAISRFFSVKKNSPLPDYRYESCPICNIDLNFIHGASPQAHINSCLDMDPEFEKGYCSGDSTCSLSSERHFRQYKHENNYSISSCAESNDNSNLTDVHHSSMLYTTSSSTSCATLCSVNTPDQISSLTGDRCRYFNSNKKRKQMKIESFFTNSSATIQKCSTEVTNGNNVSVKSRGKEQAARNYKTALTNNKKIHVPLKNSTKSCPFYKKIPGTGITVDAFRYGEISGCTAYFLTHFHSDHYVGLKRTFKGKLYCSQITANLVVSILHVDESCIIRLPMYEKTSVHDDVQVTLLDANHCPGSVMFLFQLNNGSRILHVGDFRANLNMFSGNFLSPQTIDVLYLDTTYCDAKYVFPSQNETIDFVVQTAKRFLKQNPQTLIVCGTYTIGKERVFKAIASSLGLKVAVSKQKMNVLSCLDDEELMKMLTLDYDVAQIHVLPLGGFSQKKLTDHLNKHRDKYVCLLAFKPTGWTFSGKTPDLPDIKPCVNGNVTTFGVPYSEHSSFTELQWFVQKLKPRKIIPTVNIGSKTTREKMEKFFQEWLL